MLMNASVGVPAAKTRPAVVGFANPLDTVTIGVEEENEAGYVATPRRSSRVVVSPENMLLAIAGARAVRRCGREDVNVADPPAGRIVLAMLAIPVENVIDCDAGCSVWPEIITGVEAENDSV